MSKTKLKERELTIADAISEAYGELQSLGEEMREAFDNTPESLQSSGIGEARGEAADSLENISEPDVPEVLQNIMVKWQVRQLTVKQQMKLSRSARRSEAVETLQQVIHCLEDLQDDEKTEAAIKDAATDFIDEVMQMADEAEAVEFPGMYG